MGMKRIVLLYADTGGGHRSAAEAVACGFEMLYSGQYDVSLLNAISHLAYPLNLMEKSYPLVVNHTRILQTLSFYATNGRRRSWMSRAPLRLGGRKFASVILQNHPADVYVACSPIYSQVLPHYMPRMASGARLVVVATDMVSGHATNYATEADYCLVPTEHARQEAIQYGVAAERTFVVGQPVRPDLRRRMADAETARAELGLDHHAATVLLIGGGDGMGQLLSTARAIALSGLPLQLVVVCGRNQTVKDELDRLETRVLMKTLGFVKNVPELMGAADILVTKAGAATVGEAFIARLPMLIYDMVPGQEVGNVNYVVKEGAGAWCPKPREVVQKLAELLQNPEQVQRMRQASARLARPDSALDIARIVACVSEGRPVVYP
jgi:1,2-diacylglycerol 3-beta-galactosyltransferase